MIKDAYASLVGFPVGSSTSNDQKNFASWQALLKSSKVEQLSSPGSNQDLSTTRAGWRRVLDLNGLVERQLDTRLAS